LLPLAVLARNGFRMPHAGDVLKVIGIWVLTAELLLP
jgi:hypothetical protein